MCTIHNNGNFSRDSKKIKHIQLHKKSATCMIDIMQIRNYPEMDPGSLKWGGLGGGLGCNLGCFFTSQLICEESNISETLASKDAFYWIRNFYCPKAANLLPNKRQWTFVRICHSYLQISVCCVVQKLMIWTLLKIQWLHIFYVLFSSKFTMISHTWSSCIPCIWMEWLTICI